MLNVLMIYALRTGWCALESVDTEIKDLDNWLIDFEILGFESLCMLPTYTWSFIGVKLESQPLAVFRKF